MKANHKSLWTRDTRAQVGIGTMIVFIATILVAATAAAVLIDTSGKLSERSSTTGNEATKQVASNLVVSGVYGSRDGTTDPIENLNITTGLAPGGTSVDLAQMKILMTDGDTRVELDHAATCGGANVFCINELRDPGSTLSATTFVLSKGALVEIQINLADAGSLTLPARTSVALMLIPEVGAPVHADFTTPESYGTDLLVHLR